MTAIDLKKHLRHLYTPSGKDPVQVDVPTLPFLMIDGEGDPREQGYKDTVSLLYAVAYTVKFQLKRLGHDYVVMPLEGRWWVDDLTALDFEHRDNWRWTMMILQPEHVTAEMVAQACADVRKKKELATLPPVRFEIFTEGLCAQMPYIGPYKDELPTIDRLHAYIQSHGMLTGKHHEIYLSDPNRTAPEKLKTILRQPMLLREKQPG
jgi:hypothetical protein